ncbi:MAG: YncE family protein [Terriglobales bacterium]|jgi:hypothetical protein
MKRFLWLGCVLSLYLMCSGCGETFRPIILPNPPTFPNPSAAHSVVSINDNGSVVVGSSMVIDVSGDSNVSVVNTDIHSVYGAQATASEILVVNQAVTGLNVPTTACLVTVGNQVFNVCPSLTLLNFSGTVIGSTNTVTLPIYSSPNFVAVAPGASTAYVTLPTYPPDPTNPQTVLPSVAVVSTQSRSVIATIPVVANPAANANPYSLAVTPDNAKLYVADNSAPCGNPANGICSITAFNTVDRSSRGINGSLSSPPIWMSARTDSQAVYVLEASGALAYISITSTAGPDTLIEDPAITVPSAVKMTYDGNLSRLYIPGGTEVEIVDVSQAAPAPIATIPITAISPSVRGATDPCSTTAIATLHTIDVAALPDGSRAYAGSYYEDASDNICPQVTVIDAVSNTIKTVIAVPGFAAYDAFCSTTRFRLTMAPGGDSSRAYLASCDGGMVNIIDTFTDSYILNQQEPASTRNTNPPGPQNFPQNPVFMLAGP